MKTLLAMALIAIAALTSHAWTPAMLDSPRIMAFVLSNSFWPTIFGGIALALAAGLALILILALTPSPTGRTEPEGGE